MADLTVTLFVADVVLLGVLLAGVLWSVARPDKRVWPPPSRRSWRYLLTWFCFDGAVAIGAVLLILDWNTWMFQSPLRLIIGIPLALTGGMLALWGIATVGWKITSGQRDRLVSTGPYRFTRNPQYVGDIAFLVGVGVMGNSAFLWIANLLMVLVFVVAPMTEEPWLEEQYGDAYRELRRRVPRFL